MEIEEISRIHNGCNRCKFYDEIYISSAERIARCIKLSIIKCLCRNIHGCNLKDNCTNFELKQNKQK